MAESLPVSTWEIEFIPDADRLFMRVHRCFVPHGQLNVGVFRDQGEGMSTDWKEYSSPEQTRLRANKPCENGVLSLVTGNVREIRGLLVEHTPQPDDRAHTDVFGKKEPEVRVKLSRIYKWEIPVPAMKEANPDPYSPT